MDDQNSSLSERIHAMSALELLNMLVYYRKYPYATLELVRTEVQDRGGIDAVKAEGISAGGKVPAIPPESLLTPTSVSTPGATASAPAGLAFMGGARTLKEETIWDEWHQLVDHGAGNSQRVLLRITELLAEADMPGGCSWSMQQLKSSTWFNRAYRDFLVVTIEQFGDWRMYIGVRDYGIHLDCCRFLTTEPNAVKGWVSSKLTGGDHEALSKPRNILAAQDLNAWQTIVHYAVLQAVQELMTHLGQDVGRLQRKSKGILEIW